VHPSPESNSLTAPDHYKSSQLSDPIGAFPGIALRRFDLLPSLVAKDVDKAPRGLLLPVRGCYALSERRAPGALNQRDDLSFPVSAVRFGFAGRLLSALCFLLAIGLLWPPCACASPRERLDFAFSPRRLCSCSSVLLDRVAVVTSITPARRNCNQNLW
jgi:hypothetical protein